MGMENILETDYARVDFCEEGAFVQLTWLNKKKLSFDEYKNAFNAAIDYQEENKEKTRFFLSDIREQGIVSPDFRKWLQGEAVPRTKSYGLELIAVIFTGNVFQKYYLNNIMNSTKKFGIEFKFFSKREEATEWFKSL